MNGLHFSDTLAGRVFHQSPTPAGLAIPVYTATAVIGGMPIWNPPNSNRNIELIGADFDTASGTAGYAAIGLMAFPLQAIATAAPCTVFTTTPPVNGLVLGGLSSRVNSTNAGTVTVSAGVAASPPAYTSSAIVPGWYRTLAQINGEGAAAGLQFGSVCHYDFQGTLIIPPGVMVYFAATVASGALICTGVTWKEIPLVPSQG